jgi:hypothetical protein
MVAPGALRSYVALLHDIDNYPRTMYSTVLARLVEDSGNGERIVYVASQHTGIKSRDYYARMRFEQDGNSSHTLRWQLAHGYPEDPNRVRLQALQVMTRVVADAAANQVELTIEGHVEPGGLVPAMIANRAITDTPWQTLHNVRKLVRLPQYQNAHADLMESCALD